MCLVVKRTKPEEDGNNSIAYVNDEQLKIERGVENRSKETMLV